MIPETRSVGGMRDIDPERRADCAVDVITHERQGWERPNRRPRALTARDALIALEFEALFVAVCASNMAQGIEITDDDRDRLALAYRRIDAVVYEVVR